MGVFGLHTADGAQGAVPAAGIKKGGESSVLGLPGVLADTTQSTSQGDSPWK